MTNIEKYHNAMVTALDESRQTNCSRAGIGAVILSLNGIVLGVGHNQQAADFGECNCNSGPSTEEGTSTTCQAVHAEVMALMSVSSPFKSHTRTLVSTRPPCYRCLNVLATTEIDTIVTTSEWGDRDGSKERWEGLGRTWIVLELG